MSDDWGLVGLCVTILLTMNTRITICYNSLKEMPWVQNPLTCFTQDLVKGFGAVIS